MGSVGLTYRKDQVVFVMGATGSGKSKLAMKLAAHFGGEVVNCDKMQVYDGLDVITNKVTEEERSTVPHHLLGGVHPDANYTASDFSREAALAVESILRRGRLPIVAGGSNSYIEELVEGGGGEFKSRFECCFLWVDVELPVLCESVAKRVDVMVEQGLVEEARGVFDPEADYSRGVRRAIGVPEMDRYLRAEAEGVGEVELGRLLAEAIDETKANTCRLTCFQLEKIRRLRTVVGWDIQRIDSTEVFVRPGDGSGGDEVWERVVWRPCREMVERFLQAKEEEVGAAAIAAVDGLASEDGKDETVSNEKDDVEKLGAQEGEDWRAESTAVTESDVELHVTTAAAAATAAAASCIQLHVPTTVKTTVVCATH